MTGFPSKIFCSEFHWKFYSELPFGLTVIGAVDDASVGVIVDGGEVCFMPEIIESKVFEFNHQCND